MSRIYLTRFATREALIEALAAAGLAPNGEPDSRFVDAFMDWPQVFGTVAAPSGEVECWHADMAQPAYWTANLAMDECPAALLPYRVDPPAHPRRV